MSELHKRLLAAQSELKAPKGQFNSFGKYKYRSAEDILEAVKPVNKEYELTLTLSDEPILIGEWHYIKATATISHENEQKEVTAYARESLSKKGMDDSQITGTASSYARKYALNGLYLIDDTKDADTDEYANQGKQSKPSSNKQQPKEQTLKKANTNQVKALKDQLVTYAEVSGEGDKDALDKLERWALGQMGAKDFGSASESETLKLTAIVKEKVNKKK